MKVALILFVTLVFSTELYAAKSCNSLLGATKNPSVNARKLLREAGFDPKEFRFFTMAEGQTPYDFAFYYGEKHIGGASIEVDSSRSTRKKTAYEIADIEVVGGEFRGIGLGYILYLGLAKHLYDTYGGVLNKSHQTNESNSDRMWDKLVERGFATKFGSDQADFRIKENVLRGRRLNNVGDFIQSRLYEVEDGQMTSVKNVPKLDKRVKLAEIISSEN